MTSTFEKNDAGFQYVLDKKGKADYSKHLAVYTAKAKATSKTTDCHVLMNEFLKYFRPGHIGVVLNDQNEEGKEPSNEEIRLKFQKERKIELTEQEFVKRFNSRVNRNRIEGIWNNGSYRIAIIPDEKTPGNFLAVVLKADSVYWMPGQIKAEFKPEKKGYSTSYFMRDHSRQSYTAYFPDTNSAVIVINYDYWKREYPRARLTAKEQILTAFSKSRLPFVEKLADSTLYLRIPSFAGNQKKNIDSVLAFYDKTIRSTPNLIIDIRYGTGGSDASYRNLSPYLYTNPIRTVGMELLATDMNAAAYKKYADQSTDTADVNWCLRVSNTMKANPGKFIDMDGEKVSVDSSYKMLPYPRKVAIMCNRKNGSTDEQFLLEAKQSRKVKVYGHSTGGMLDISNMNFVEFPDKRFTLAYCMSKSYRIPNFCIDGIGIQPDHFIDDTIPEEDWIYYVKREIEK
jgi:hypothetical protein